MLRASPHALNAVAGGGSGVLVFMIVYVWSRHNPDQTVSLMGMVQLKAFWLPWALMLLTMIMGGSPLSDFLGILVGHLYYFLTTLHPRAGGGNYTRTPQVTPPASPRKKNVIWRDPFEGGSIG